MINKISFEIKDAVCEFILKIRLKTWLKKHYKKCKKNNIPIAKYDTKLRKAYLEYSDGSKTYIE